MKNRIKFRPLGPVAKAADSAMYPFMRISMELNGTADESPQMTHWWNNQKLSTSDVGHLDQDLVAKVNGDPTAWRLPGGLRHFPWIGWQRYVVLRPRTWVYTWYVGWVTHDVIGISRIPIVGPVKTLRGPEETIFFAVDAAGQQLAIEEVGRGKLGDGKFPTVPLH